ncbi:hypothetical protein ACWC6I_44845 [Streptomyces sp. NPDC001414]
MLDALVESVGKAFRAYGASGAQGLGSVLGGSVDEQLVRISSAAQSAYSPAFLAALDHLGTVLSPDTPRAPA